MTEADIRLIVLAYGDTSHVKIRNILINRHYM